MASSSYPSRVPFSVLKKRLKRRLYYGFKTQLDRLSFPLTELAISYFDKNAPFDSLDWTFATSLSREACVNPSTLVVALLYLERVRGADRNYFQNSDPANLYTTALLLANKYLFDQGEDDYIYNDEWAASASLPLSSVNKSELRLLQSLNWNLKVTADQFEAMLEQMETKVALQQSSTRRNGFTYSDLTVLLNWMNLYSLNFWTDLSDAIVKCLCGLSIAYAVGVVSYLTAVGLKTHQPAPVTQHSGGMQGKFELHHNQVDHLSSVSRCQPDSLCFLHDISKPMQEDSPIDPEPSTAVRTEQETLFSTISHNQSERDANGLLLSSTAGITPGEELMNRSFWLPKWSCMKVKAIPIAT